MVLRLLLAHSLPLFVVGVACSSSAGRAPAVPNPGPVSPDASHANKTPAAPTKVTSCGQAIAPLTTLWQPPIATPTSTAAFGSARTTLSQALADLCQADAWSPQSRACLSQAASLRAFDQCLAALPAQQLAHVSSTSNAIVAAIPVPTVAP